MSSPACIILGAIFLAARFGVRSAIKLEHRLVDLGRRAIRALGKLDPEARGGAVSQEHVGSLSGVTDVKGRGPRALSASPPIFQVAPSGLTNDQHLDVECSVLSVECSGAR